MESLRLVLRGFSSHGHDAGQIRPYRTLGSALGQRTHSSCGKNFSQKYKERWKYYNPITLFILVTPHCMVLIYIYICVYICIYIYTVYIYTYIYTLYIYSLYIMWFHPLFNILQQWFCGPVQPPRSRSSGPTAPAANRWRDSARCRSAKRSSCTA